MGTAGRIKSQFMALVDTGDLDRMDALRVVMRVSRAEVNRQVLRGASLENMELAADARLSRLDVVAGRAGLLRAAFVRALVDGRVKVPALEELEAMTTEDLHAELRDLPGQRNSGEARFLREQKFLPGMPGTEAERDEPAQRAS
jgi:hypothetical protein